MMDILSSAHALPIRLLDGESAEPRYIGNPAVPEAYRSRRASAMGEVHYQFVVPAGGPYELILGFCERKPAPDVPVTYPVDIVIEGRPARSVDVARELGAEQPHDLPFPARDDNGDGRLDVVVRPVTGAIDPIAWISRIQLKKGDETLADVNCGAEGPDVEIALVQPDRAPSPYHAVLSTGNQWVYFGVNGEVRELWARGRLYAPRVPRYCLASGYLSLLEDDAWQDSRTMRWNYGWLPDTNILAMAGKLGDRNLRLVAFSPWPPPPEGWDRPPRLPAGRESPVHPEDLLVLQYHIENATGTPFRYRWISQYQDWDAPIVSTWDHGVVLRNRSLEYVALGASIPVKVRWASPESQHVDLLGEWAGETVSIFIAVGRDPALLRQRMDEAARRDAAGHLREAESADRAWLARTARVRTPEPSLNRLYTRALLNVRGNSFDTGVLIAGSDGWYKHAWIRDGGYTTMGLDLAGLHDEAERFYRYWLADAGFSYGGENECQQPAIGILGFLHHYHLTGDRQLLTDAWPYVERYADYYRGRIEREGMVHTAEEWINQIPAQTAWPNAEIYAGLVAAAEISMLLGKRREDDWLSAAVELRRAIRETAYDPMLGRFRPLSGKWTDDRVDSGMLNLARLGVFRPHVSACTPGDPAMTGTVAQIKRELQQADYAISRFTGNRRGYGYPTGQWAVWPISTAWMAQYHLLLGEPSAALLYLSAVARKQGYPYDAALWYLPEQMAITGQPVSTRNLAWSNGEFIASLLLLLTGYVPDHAAGRARLAPGLPLGWPEASVDNLELMGARISLRVQRQGQERTLSLTHGAGPAVRLQLRLPADALPDPEAIHVNGEPVAWKSDVGWIDLAGEWTLSSASPELTARWREPLAPPCGIAWDTLASASVAGLEDIPEAARLSATLTHLLGLPDDPQRPSIVFQPASLPPTQYRFPLVTEPASASGVVVEYGGPLGAKRAARRLVLEAERYGHRHRLPAQREANSDLQRHLGRRP